MDSRSPDIPIDDFPSSIQDVVKNLGVDAALKLVECYGGRRLYISKQLHPDHHLVRSLGLETANRLFRLVGTAAGGSLMDVPKATLLLAKLRNKQIHQDRADGVTPRELARRLNLTERHIRRILASSPQIDRSPSSPSNPSSKQENRHEIHR